VDFDAASGGVNASADVFGKGNQEFTGGSVDGKQRRAGLRFAGEKNIANSTRRAGLPKASTATKKPRAV